MFGLGFLNGRGGNGAAPDEPELTPEKVAALRDVAQAAARRSDHEQARRDGRVYTLDEIRQALVCAVVQGVVTGRQRGVLPCVRPGTPAETRPRSSVRKGQPVEAAATSQR